MVLRFTYNWQVVVWMRFQHVLDTLFYGGLCQQLSVEQLQHQSPGRLSEYHLLAEELSKDCVHEILVQILIQRLIVDGPQFLQYIWYKFQEELAYSRY